MNGEHTQRFICPVYGCPGHAESFHMCPRASQYLSVSPEEAITYAIAAVQDANKRLDSQWPYDSLVMRLERSVRFLVARLNYEMQRKGEPLRTSTPDETTPVTPEFAAGFERGTVAAVLKELDAFVQDRDNPYWHGFAFALEEIRARLELAWKALPAVEPSDDIGAQIALAAVNVQGCNHQFSTCLQCGIGLHHPTKPAIATNEDSRVNGEASQ